MREPAAVHEGEAARDACEERARLLERGSRRRGGRGDTAAATAARSAPAAARCAPGPVNGPVEPAALGQLEHEREAAVRQVRDAVERQDVGVAQRGKRARLALE